MNQSELMNLIIEPHISEKTTVLADRDKQFVFKVRYGATKPQIRRAVEAMFNVKVASVRVANMIGKPKGWRGTPGRRSAWRKAYVKLAPGYDIDFRGPE